MSATIDIQQLVLQLSDTCARGKVGLWQLTLVICGVLCTIFIIYSRTHRWVSASAPGAALPILGAWAEAYRLIHHSHTGIENIIRKGAKERTFRISMLARWVVTTTDPRVLKELQNVDEAVLSMQAAANERNSIGYILSESIHHDPYHIKIISKNLTLRLNSVLPEIVQETSLGLRELLAVSDKWTPIRDLGGLLSRCVAGTTNRILVGLPLCRDEEYLDCLVQLSKRMSRAGLFCDLAPRFLKPLIAHMLVRQSLPLRMFLSKLGTLFERRRRMLTSCSNGGQNRPNDAVQWILEAAPPNTSIYELCIRVLYLDFSAIHTTSISITQALYDLAAHREFQAPIRDEIEHVLRDSGGWTKQTLTKMRKLNSSLKESQRLHPVTTATMMRRAQKPYTLSDGTHLPQGQWVVAPAYSINRSPQHHADPETFDAFRFSWSAEQDAPQTRCEMAYPEPGYLSFGMGKHACPGRFFAAAELKIVLAYITYNYEFKFPDGKRPEDKVTFFLCLPDFGAEILFRRRSGCNESVVHMMENTCGTEKHR